MVCCVYSHSKDYDFSGHINDIIFALLMKIVFALNEKQMKKKNKFKQQKSHHARTLLWSRDQKVLISGRHCCS